MWTCPECKREFLRKQQAHSCVHFPLENHFKNKGLAARPLFDSLVKAIEKEIGPVKIESLPCCIHLVSSYTFGAVWALKDKIRIDFRIDTKISDPRVSKEVQMSPNRFLYYLDIKDQQEIDDKLIAWLRKAYFLTRL